MCVSRGGGGGGGLLAFMHPGVSGVDCQCAVSYLLQLTAYGESRSDAMQGYLACEVNNHTLLLVLLTLGGRYQPPYRQHLPDEQQEERSSPPGGGQHPHSSHVPTASGRSASAVAAAFESPKQDAAHMVTNC